MKRDTRLGPCRECGSTSVVGIGRGLNPALFLVSPLIAGLSSTAVRDLMCEVCGARWSLADAERLDPWSTAPPRFPHTPADDFDEDELDAKWQCWTQDE